MEKRGYFEEKPYFRPISASSSRLGWRFDSGLSFLSHSETKLIRRWKQKGSVWPGCLLRRRLGGGRVFWGRGLNANAISEAREGKG